MPGGVKTILLSMLVAAWCLVTRADTSPPHPVNSVLITTARTEERMGVKPYLLWLPGQEKLTSVWSDQPFALQIPFTMDMEYNAFGRMGQFIRARVFVTSLGSPAATNSTFNLMSTGMYRLDGQPVYKDETNKWSVTYDAFGGDGVLHWSPFDKNLAVFTQMVVECAAAPVVAEQITAPGPMMFWLVLDPRPRTPGSGGLCDWTLMPDKCVAKFRAELYHVNPETLEERPLKTNDFEVVVRQNGWQLQEAVTKTEGDWDKPRQEQRGGDAWSVLKLQDGGIQSANGGGQVSFLHKLSAEWKEAGENAPKKQAEWAYRMSLDFPKTSWFDYQLAPLRVEWSCSAGSVQNGWGMGAYTGIEQNQATIWRYTLAPGGGITNKVATSGGWNMPRTTENEAGAWSQVVTASWGTARAFIANDGTNDISFQQGTLPSYWTAYQKAGKQKIFSFEVVYTPAGGVRMYPVVPDGKVPVKRVEIFGTRLSEMGDTATALNVTAQVTRDEEPDDGYWEWVVKFRKLAQEHRSQIQLIRQQLQVLAGQERHLRQQWLASFRLDLLAHESLSEMEGLSDYLTGGGNINLSPTRTKTELEAMKQRRDELAAQINSIPAEQEALIQQALRLQKQLTESADVQSIRSKESHPDINRKVELLKDEYSILRLRLYEDAKLYNSDTLQQILQEFHGNTKPEDELAKLLTAKMALARADREDRKLWLQAVSPTKAPINDEAACTARADARAALKEVLRINPKNTEAATLVKNMDLDLVNGILAKLEGEKKASMDGFRRYLQGRGLNPENSGSWPRCTWEFLKFWWGNGPTSLAAGFPGLDAPGVMANDASIVAEGAAKDQVSLLAIRRLLKRGVPLEQIRNISRDDLQNNMTAETSAGKSLSAEQVGRLCQDIRETFSELGDLRALAEGNRDVYLKLHSQAYYGTLDADKTGVEHLVDFVASPASLVMWFGPGAICKINGKWVRYSDKLPGPRELALLEETGQVVRGRELVYTNLRLKELGDWLATKPPGKFLQAAFEADRRCLEDLSGFTRFLNGSGRLGATMVIFAGGGHLGEEYGGPYLRWLIEAITMLGPDEMAAEILARDGTPFRKFLGQMDDLKKLVAAERRQLLEADKAIQRMEILSQRLSSSQTLTANRLSAAEAKELEAFVSRDTIPMLTPVLPGSVPREDLESALTISARALQRGQPAEAKRALQAARSISEEMQLTLDGVDVAWVKASEVIANNPRLRGVVPDRQFGRIIDDIDPAACILGKNNPGGVAGDFLMMGDRAVARGDFEKASDLYLAAMHQGVERTVAHRRLALIEFGKVEMRRLAELRAKAPRCPSAEPITETEEQLATLLNSGKVQLEYRPGSANPVFFVKDAEGTKYVFKAIDDEDDAFAECLAPLLLDKLNNRSPAVRYVRKVNVTTTKEKRSPSGTVLTDKDGKPITEATTERVNGILVRYAKGKELSELCEAHVLALKDEVARLRAFRLWFGDCDGHMGNFLFLDDAHLVPIDFGLAQLRSSLNFRQLDIRGVLKAKIGNQEELMMEMLKFSSWVGKAAEAGKRITDKQMAACKWVDRIDAMLNYDDMEATVNAIKELCNRNEGADLKALLRQALPEGAMPEMIDEAFQVLKERSDVLEKVLRTRFTKFKPTNVTQEKTESYAFAE